MIHGAFLAYISTLINRCSMVKDLDDDNNDDLGVGRGMAVWWIL